MKAIKSIKAVSKKNPPQFNVEALIACEKFINSINFEIFFSFFSISFYFFHSSSNTMSSFISAHPMTKKSRNESYDDQKNTKQHHSNRA